jgi:hypothetical protein
VFGWEIRCIALLSSSIPPIVVGSGMSWDFVGAGWGCVRECAACVWRECEGCVWREW